MTTSDEYMTRRQARDWARRLARLERRQRSTAAAHADLRHSAIDGGARIPLKDTEGNTTAFFGGHAPGGSPIQYVGGETPNQPAPAFVVTGQGDVKVQSSGLDVHDDLAPADLKHVEVHAAQVESFEPSLSTLANHLSVANGSVDHSLSAGEWWIGLVWVTLSGKRSVMSEPVLADIEPPVDAEDIQRVADETEQRLDAADEYAQERYQEFDTRQSEFAEAIDAAEDRIEEAENILSPLPGRIETAEREVNEAKDAAEAAEARAVEANNRSMTRLANGNFESGLDYWDTYGVTLSEIAHSGQQAARIGSGGWVRPASSFPVVPGQIWELSLYHQMPVDVAFESVTENGDRTTLQAHDIMGTLGLWSDTGTLRLTIPADVDLLGFTITGDSALVDDIVLRDVTDVVRLEQAATANRQEVERLTGEYELLQLAVDGPGGIKDRISTAETTLDAKAGNDRLDELAAKLTGDLTALESHFTRIWGPSATPPPAGTTYEWAGEPHASESIKRVDGVEVARNLVAGSLAPGAESWGWFNLPPREQDPDGTYFVTYGYAWNLRLHVLTAEPGYYAMSFYARQRVRGNSLRNGQARVNRTFMDANDQGVGESFEQYHDIQDDGQWHKITVSAYAPEESEYIDSMLLTGAGSGDLIDFSRFTIVVADTEADALAQVETYFDGDTASDRANDLWYDEDGVRHVWVNGQGWTVLDDVRLTELVSQVDTLGDRLGDAETQLTGKADTTALNALDGVLRQAFGEADQAVSDAAAQDAQDKATAAREAAETEAHRLARAEAEAARLAAEANAADDALAKAEAARDEAISSASDDAELKAEAAREAAETAAKAHADLQAAAAQAEAIRQANAEAERLANAAQAAAEAAAKDYADQQDATIKAEAAADAQSKADAAKDAAETAANAHADLVASGAEGAAIAEAERLHELAVAAAEAARAEAEAAHSEAGEAWSHADAAMNRATTAETTAIEHANALPKSLGGLTPPTGTAPDGSVWRQRNADNTIIARWERIDGAWVEQAVSGEIIDNLEAGKITALYTQFAESVIGTVWAQLGVYDRIDAREGYVGGTHLKDGAVTAEKMTITGDLAAAIIEADVARVAELLADEVWAKQGVFERLQSVEGWIGETLLADGAVTAEKITATREMVTKLLGAEWAYISERLVVEGDLIAAHADIISAVIKNLDVTEQSNFVDAFAEQLYAEEFTARVATMARAIVAAPNLIPHWSQIHERLPDGFEAWGYSDIYQAIWADTSPRRDMTTRFSLVAGETYKFSVDVRSTIEGNRFHIPLRTGGGHVQFILQWERPGTEFTRFEAEFTVDETRDDYYLGIQALVDDQTGYQWFKDIRLHNMLDGRLTVPGSIDVGSLNVTEEMVAAFARILHLVVDQMDVNTIWADTTWQAAGHFGSSDADQSTLVDGTGMRITRHGDENYDATDLVRLGGEGIGLVFADDTGEVTGSLSYEGDASFRDVSVESLSHGGRPLQDTDCQEWYHPSGNQSLISWRPRAVIARAQREFPTMSTDYTVYGFLEAAATLEAGRSYWITVTPFSIRDPGGTANYLHLRYTTDGTPPDNNSLSLASFRQALADTSRAVQHGGQTLVTPQVTAHYRIMAAVQQPNGITNNFTNQAPVQLIIEDAGSAAPDGTVIRETMAGHPTQPDVLGPIISQDSVTTEWEATWYQNYSHGGTTRASGSNTSSGYMSGALVQGYRRERPATGIWRSMFGFNQSTDGQTFTQALNGVSVNNIQSITVELHGWSSQGLGHRTNYGIVASSHTSAPNTFTANTQFWWVGTYQINAGQTRRISLDVEEYAPLLKTGDLNALGLWTPSTADLNSGYLRWSGPSETYRPRVIISYTKEG